MKLGSREGFMSRPKRENWLVGVEDARTELKESLGGVKLFRWLVCKEEDDATRGLFARATGLGRQNAGFRRSASGPVGQCQGVEILSLFIQN